MADKRNEAPPVDNSDVKARVNEQGNTDTFFGGDKGKADGPGHGHVVTTPEGEHVYVRDSAANMPDSSRADRVSVDKDKK
jgi:hypothetical protein